MSGHIMESLLAHSLDNWLVRSHTKTHASTTGPLMGHQTITTIMMSVGGCDMGQPVHLCGCLQQRTTTLPYKGGNRLRGSGGKNKPI